MIPMRSGAKRLAAQASNVVLGALAPVLTRQATAQAIPKSPRVLVIRCDHIGDAVMATAILGPLRRVLNACQLDVLAGPWAAAIFRSHSEVDEVLEVATPWWLAARGASRRERLAAWRGLPAVVRELRRRRYDIGIDLRGDLRQILAFLALGGCTERVSSNRTGGERLLTKIVPHRRTAHEVERNSAMVQAFGAAAGPLQRPPLPPLPEWIHQRLVDSGASGDGIGYVVLSSRGSFPAKSRSTDGSAELVRHLLRERRGLVVLVGGAAEWSDGERIVALNPQRVVNLCGVCPLGESMAVIAGADAAIAVDSGPMHLAALVGTPVVALFGPTDPRTYAPWTSSKRIIHAACDGCASACRRTDDGASACLNGIAPFTIMRALEDLLAEESVREVRMTDPERPAAASVPAGLSGTLPGRRQRLAEQN